MTDYVDAKNKIDSMPIENLANIVKKALEDSNIPYTEGKGYIEFDGLKEVDND